MRVLSPICLVALFLFIQSQLIHSSHATELKFDSDVQPSIKKEMLTDIEFLKTIRFSKTSTMHKKVYGETPNYAGWFSERIFTVGWNLCGDGNAVACVIPKEDPNKMSVTENYVKFNHPQIAKLSVLLHEARHSEVGNDFWRHAKCPDPYLLPDGREVRSIWTGASLAQEAACDRTPYGSYGVGIIMLKNIQKYCLNCNEKAKMDAGIYGDDLLIRITNPYAKEAMIQDFANAKKTR